MTALTHSILMMIRHLRTLVRQPWYIAFTLVQPVIWLVLNGQVFKRVVDIPGFHVTSYISFLTPGIVMMTALFAAGWSGMGTIADLNRGIMDRFLITPVHRSALITGRVLSLALSTLVQSLILVGLGTCLGARFEGGITGFLIMLLCAMFLSAPFAALSNAMALVTQKEESVIGASNFVLLPLTFISPVFMAPNLMPPWIQIAARFNPVNWAVLAARSALSSYPDWTLIGTYVGLLLGFAIASAALATRAFHAYQKAI